MLEITVKVNDFQVSIYRFDLKERDSDNCLISIRLIELNDIKFV